MADYAKGQLLLELRNKRNESRENVAAAIGVTTKTLYSWEKLDGGIKMDNARRLADYYGVDDPATLIRRESDGGDQLDRLERKLDQVLLLLAAPTRSAEREALVADILAERAPTTGAGDPG